MDRSLYDMITYLQRGTKMHIGALFFGNYGNRRCELPHQHTIHSGAVCAELKERSKSDYKRCFGCRNLALKKALTAKHSFGGLCINGLYEYTHPVVIDGEVACVIFIGNILDDRAGCQKLLKNVGDKTALLDTLEQTMTEEDCIAIGDLLESYILMLLEKYTDQNADTNPLIENIKKYIHSNLEFDINISHIADCFHYNKLYLGRLFKQETGMSIKDYITFQRIELAKSLLVDSNETILTIANSAGFNNVTYFNRVFKRILHVTPTQYRSSKRSEANS